MQRFRGGLVFTADRLLYYSTLGVRVIKKKKKVVGGYQGFVGVSGPPAAEEAAAAFGLRV